MKLVIDLPEEDYIRLRDEGMFGNVTTFKRAVREGIPLEQEPCDDAISRQAVLEKTICAPIAKVMMGDKVIYRKIVFVDEIENIPPVTPAEKVGRWIARGLVDSNGNRIYECSECHHSDIQAATMIVPYCWYCGAKMQEVKA